MIGQQMKPRVKEAWRWLWRSKLRVLVSTALAVLMAVWAVFGIVNAATGGYWFDPIFPWRTGKQPPEVVKIFARERGQEVAPVVAVRGGLFLAVDALDPEGDTILHEWSAAEGIIRAAR